MNYDLFNAILAMDAYNRGYDAGIDLPDSENTELGTATIYTTKGDASAQQIGFYALAYSYDPDGAGSAGSQTIISFRGTDDLEWGATGNPLGTPDDIYHGWSLGDGNILSQQGLMALQFYQSVDAATTDTISSTGHSLGGGLAGYVSTLHDDDAVVFDSMAFETAAFNMSAFDPGLEYDVEGISGYRVEGEVLGLTPWSSTAVQDLDLETGTLLNPVDLHSIATLVIRMFADVGGEGGAPLADDWIVSAEYFWPALYDASLAKLILGGASNISGKLLEDANDPTKDKEGNYAEILREVIAYSAIDEGTRPFGDTGIRALYDDANDLGVALSAPYDSQAIEDHADLISRAFVQFAGHLALKAVLQENASNAVDGVLGLTDTAFNATLTVDFTDETWTTGGGAPSVMAGRASLAGGLLDTMGGGDDATLRLLMGQLWGDTTANVFDRIIFALNESDENQIAGTSDGVTMFIAGSGDDTVTGTTGRDLLYGGSGVGIDELDGGSGDDILIGSGGADILHGGGDNDILLGQAADDQIFGDDGDDRLNGGAGDDELDGGAGNDAVDFSDTAFPVAAEFSTVSGETEIAITTDPSLGTDTLVSIESVVGSQGDDTFTLLDLDFVDEARLDGQGETTFLGDTLILTNLDEAVTLNFDVDEGTGEIEGAEVTFKNIEHFFGTTFADTFNFDGADLSETNVLIEGGTNTDGLDIVDFSNVSGGVTVDNGVASGGIRIYGVEEIVGTSNADIFRNIAPDTIIRVGADGSQDIVSVGDNIFIADMGTEDRIDIFGVTLTGAGRFLYSESPWTNLNGAVKFSRNVEGDLLIQTTFNNAQGDPWNTYVANYQNTLDGAAGNTAGIFIFNQSTGVYRLYEYAGKNPPPSIMNNFKALDAHLKAGLGDKFTGTVDPLAIDLDSDGLEIRPETTLSPHFDMNGDGFAERAGWVGPDDGFVARDLNADGKINDISELFGDETQSGFTHLSALDSNSDGKVDAADAAFSSLRIWRDADQDGVTDAGELKTLAELGIQSINVTPDSTTLQEFNGYNITATGTYTRTDLTTGGTGNIVYRNNTYDTHWLTSVTISPEAAALPEVKGHGTLPGLRAAMSYAPSLVTVVQNTLSALDTPNLAALRDAVMPILNAWAAAVGVPAGSPGTDARIDVPVLVATTVKDGAQVLDYGIRRTDAQGSYWELASGDDVLDASGQIIARPTFADITAQHPPAGSNAVWDTLTDDTINFLERWTGIDLPIGDDTPGGSAALNGMKAVIGFMWTELNKVVVAIASQSTDALQDFFGGVTWNPSTEKFEPPADGKLSHMLEAIFADAPGNPAGDLAHLQSWKGLIDIVIENFDRGGDYLLPSYSYLFQNVVAAHENTPMSLDIINTAGALDIPEDMIVTGAGEMSGTNDADIFYMDGTAQTARGGNGPDSYVFGRDFGSDVIVDVDVTLGSDQHDTIRFAHYGTADIKAARDGNDLILTVLDGLGQPTAHSVRVVDQFAERPAGLTTAYLYFARGISEIVFADGAVWDRVDMAYAVSDPLAGNQTIFGTGQTDVLDGGAGNDNLYGQNQSDIYIYGAGYGNDVIFDDQETSHDVLLTDFDILQFKDGINLEDVTFLRSGGSDNLAIRVDATGETVTIMDQFDAHYTIITGTQWFSRIEGLVFADGLTMGWDEVMEYIPQVLKTSGDDTIYGFAWEDVLDGGAGNDFLSGGEENDTYMFGLGYGNDEIHEKRESIFSGTTDTVLFWPDVDPATVMLGRDGASDDLTITLSDGSTLTIIDQFKLFNTFIAGVQGFDRVENFVFQDVANTVWTHDDVMDMVIAQSSTSGDDFIYGYMREDTLNGGAGNDYMAGGAEGDTYHFGRGYGNDTIYDFKDSAPIGSDIDRLIFTSDVTPADIKVEVGPGHWDMVLRIIDTDETVTILKQNHRFVLGPPYYEIEEVVFADSTIWTPQDMRDMYLENAGTSGNDHIYGFWTNDVIDGGAGDDFLEGSGGGDTYIFDAGYGHDTIYDYITKITWTGQDTVQFTGTIVQSDVTFTRNRGTLEITLNGTTDQLDLLDFYTDSGVKWVERFVFSDSSVLTYSDVYTLTAGSVVKVGNEGNNNLDGTAGHDQIFGLGGNDHIRAFEGNDIIDGGEGDDDLEGGSGGDIYYASPGNDIIDDSSGVDKIVFGPGVSAVDVEFYHTENFPYDDLTIVWNEGTVTVHDHFNNTNSANQIEQLLFDDATSIDLVNRNFITKGTSGNDSIGGISSTNTYGFLFDDTLYGLAGNDTLTGGNGNDTLDGGEGNDLLNGGANNDTYLIGSGSDRIDEGGGLDEIVFGDGIAADDLQIYRATGYSGYKSLFITWGTSDQLEIWDFFSTFDSNQQVESIRFSDGSTLDLLDMNYVTWGTSGNDSLSGIGAVDDDSGLNQGDIVYGLEGNDTIAGNNGDDTLYGGDGIDTVDGEDGNDLLYGGEGDDYLEGGSGNDTIYGEQGHDTIFGESFNDTIYGGDGNDTINPGTGNDIVYGGDGNDVITASSSSSSADDLKYIYGEGGNDIITMADGNDTVHGGDGDDTISGDLGNDHLNGGEGNDTINGNGGNDNIRGDAGNDIISGSSGNDTIDAGDGADTINGGTGADSILGGAGNDSIDGADDADNLQGEDGDDLLDGNAGNDMLFGGVGNDTYFYEENEGIDTFTEELGSADVISMTDDRRPEHITFSTVNTVDLKLSFSSTSYMLIAGFFNGGGANVIETLHFSDGFWLDLGSYSSWVFGSSSGQTTNGGSGIDTILGRSGNDTINGNAGNDHLSGDGGTDTLSGGDGDDYVHGGSSNDTVNGNDGADHLFGGSSNDTVNGGIGDDWMDGGSGDDTLDGGTGDDYIFGNTGTDTVTYASATSAVSVNLFSGVVSGGYGSDTVVAIEHVTGSIYDDVLYSSVDSNTLNGGSGTDTVSYVHATGAVTANLGTGSATGHGTDTLTSIENLIGSAYNDTLTGSTGNNVMEGGAGNDTMDGGSGTDTVSYAAAASAVTVNISTITAQNTGGAGTDTITNFENILGSVYNDILTGDSAANVVNGGAGNDTIEGAAGDDTLDGGSNTDTLSYANAASAITINLATVTAQNTGGAGTDTISGFENLTGSAYDDILTGDSAANVITGSAGNDTLIGKGGADVLDGGSGTDTVDYSAAASGVTVNLSSGTASDDGDGGSDTLSNIENIIGSGNADTISGDSNDNVLDGGSGTDTVSYAGAGSSVTVSLANGSAQATGGAGTDTISNFENLTGSAYNDSLIGNSSANLITGGAGNDTLSGAAGDDTYVYNAGDGNDVITDSAGVEIIKLGSGLTSGDVDFTKDGDDLIITVGAGSITVVDHFVSGSAVETLLFNDSSIIDLTALTFAIEGTSGADTLTGTADADTIYGYAGNDTISGLAGDDIIYGGDDNDTLKGGTGNDTLDGGVGTDTADYSGAAAGATVNLSTGTASNDGDGGSDTISNVENVLGSANVDTITGDSGANIIEGGAGNDTLDGSSGTDTVSYAGAGSAVTVNLATGTAQNTVGAGTDTISNFENLTGSAYNDTLTGNTAANIISGGGGNDIVKGAAGNDTLDGSSGTDTADYSAAASGITVNLTTGTASDGDGGTDTLTAIENVTGSGYADTITGDSGANTLSGGSGNDTLKGGAGNDIIDGGSGVDTVDYSGSSSGVTVDLNAGTASDGDGGTDTLTNIEYITGSAFADTLTGTSSNNIIYGGAGNDIIYGLGLNDTLHGEDGDDTLYGGDGTDGISGGNGNDIIYTGDGANTTFCSGGNGNDILYGGDGNNSLGGSADNDTLYGMAGNDSLSGDSGSDILYGGDGSDTVQGNSDGDILYGGDGLDTLKGEGDGGGYAGYDAFVFEAASAFNNVDVITDFSKATIIYDLIDISDLLSAYDPGTEDINDFINVRVSGADSYLQVDADGGGNSFVDVVKIQGVTGLSSIETMIAERRLIIAGESIFLGGTNVNDNITGTSGSDVIFTSNGTDTVYGGAGDDYIRLDGTGTAYGDDGDDILIADDPSGSSITFYGGNGNDTLYVMNGDDIIHGGGGNDTVIYLENSTNYIIYRENADYLTVRDTTNSNDDIDFIYNDIETIQWNDITLDLTSMTFDLNGLGWGTPIVVNDGSVAQTLYGFNVNDTIYGNGGHDTIYGYLGDDLLDGGTGNDTIYAGDGNDTLSGGTGWDIIDGGVGTDVVSYLYAPWGMTINLSTGTTSTDSGLDTLSNIENVIGTNYDDTIIGNSGANVLDGAAGNDTINLASGDFVTGESITGGSGTDSLVLTSGQTVDFTIGTLATLETLTGSNSDDTVTMLAGSFAGMFTTINLGSGSSDVLNIVASGDISSATAATISNTETGNLTGTSGSDTITLTGAQLDAIIIGSGTINFGSGSGDTINLTSTSSDLNTLGATDASIQGVEAISASTAGFGVTITLSGQTEVFTLTGSSSADTITAGSGADTVTGGSGNDTLTGGAGNDLLYGSGGNDTLYGGANDDLIYGQDGDDSLTGDGGADIFVFEAATAFNNVDDIQDFSTGQSDKLDISDILDGFYTYGTDDITQFVQITDNGTDSTLAIDQNGGGDNFVSVAMILGITGLTNEASLETSGALITH